MSFKSGFESIERERESERERERKREWQFNTAGGSEFQVRGAALLNDRLANDVRRNGTHSTAVGRMTIKCCVRWCATRCSADSDSEINLKIGQ